jgi:hypothetical protein
MNIGEMIKKHHLLILGGVVVAAAFWYDRNKANSAASTVSNTTPAAGSSSFTGYANMAAGCIGSSMGGGGIKSGLATPATPPTLKSLGAMSCAQLTQEYNYWLTVQNNTKSAGTSTTGSIGSIGGGVFGGKTTTASAQSSNSCTPCYLDLILSVIQSKGCKFTSSKSTSPFHMGFTGDIES